MLLPLRLAWGACLLIVSTTCASLRKNVVVSMDAKFSQTPLLLEASEFFAEHSAGLYWTFVDRVASAPQSSFATDEGTWKWLTDAASDVLGDTSLPVLEYSLATHYYSARIELFRKILDDTLSELDAEGFACDHGSVLFDSSNAKFACDLDVGSLGEASPEQSELILDEVDHIFSAEGSNEAPVVILYGDFSSEGFGDLYAKCVGAANDGKILLTLRPKVSAEFLKAARSLQLQGFGAELAMKNMEYKVLDDSKKHEEDGEDADGDAAADKSGGFDPDEEIDGFKFATMSERYPDLEEDLELFRDYLHDVQDDTKVNIWDMNEMGYQAAQRIILAKDQFLALKDISQDFPSLGKSLSKLAVNKSVKEEIKRIHDGKTSVQGRNILMMNGLELDPSSLDIYDFQQVLRRESVAIDALRSIGFTRDTAMKMLALPMQSGGGGQQGGQRGQQGGATGGVNLGDDYSSVFFFNDLETDEMYQDWPKTVKQLMRPVWPGQLNYVAKNLYHLIVVCDGSSRESLRLLAKSYEFVEMNAPAYAGVVFMSDLADSEAGGNEGDGANPALDAALAKLGSGDSSADADTELSAQSTVSLLAYYLLDNHGKAAMSDFVSRIIQLTESPTATSDKIDAEVVKEAFTSFQEASEAIDADAAPIAPVDDILANAAVKERSLKAQRYLQRKGLALESSAMEPTPFLVFNGLVKFSSAEKYRETMMRSCLMGQHQYAQQVYFGKLDDTMNLTEHIYSDPSFSSAYSLLAQSADASYLKSIIWSSDIFDSESSPSNEGSISYAESNLDEVKPVSVWLVEDFASAESWTHVESAVEALQFEYEGEMAIRVAFLPALLPGQSLDNPFVRALIAPLSKRPAISLAELGELARAAGAVFSSNEPSLATQREVFELTALAKRLKSLEAVTKESSEGYAALTARLSKISQLVLAELDLPFSGEKGESDPDQETYRAVVVNGKVLPVPAQYEVTRSDILALASLEFSSHSEAILEAMGLWVEYEPDKVGADDIVSSFLSDVALRASFALGKRESDAEHPPREFPVPSHVFAEHSILRHESDSYFQIRAIIDPLSLDAQRVSAILVALRDAFDFDMTVYLAPANEFQGMPIKRFYRFSFSPSLSFTQTGSLHEGVESATFRNLPPNQVLTMAVDTPESWLVQSKEASYDLDNLLLNKMPEKQSTMHVRYSLEHLLITGHSHDFSGPRLEPPSGLQLILGTPAQPHVQDTVVMQNLGYFQLKAAPGVWYLDLAPGANRQVFKIADGVKTVRGGKLAVPVGGLNEGSVRLQVKRREGMEGVDLMEVISSAPVVEEKEEEESGFLGRIFGGKKKAKLKAAPGALEALRAQQEADEDDNTIHVMSVASGLLYERFLRIMMLSVVETTKSAPVKFWFLEQFLSPEFKEMLPQFAEDIGCQVELVTYKWPIWLHRETEKQRIIWGYKILFLDVLFPLKLKRIIFVDADQIVRADLGELWTMDLQGAPYAYTPFCDSNEETKGFRFWDTGYWKSHLGSRPYHISALYVVDLQVFRRQRTGDQLRIFYDQLSRDANSLSNLDQDLPNYAQTAVKIHSLPQEWLWCETWCSAESLKDAKTIDLCNNPLTKEPKLDKARRLLPEWVVYDDKQQAQFDAFLKQRSISSSASAASTKPSGKTEL